MVSTSNLLITSLAVLTTPCLCRPVASPQEMSIQLSPGRSAMVHVAARDVSDATTGRSMPYTPITDLDLDSYADAVTQAVAKVYDSLPLSTVVVDQYSANTLGHVVPDPGEGVWQDFEKQSSQLRLKSRNWLHKIFASKP